MLGQTLNSEYRALKFGGQAWVRHGLFRSVDGHMKLGYLIPITKKHYLDVGFYYAHDDNVLPRDMHHHAFILTDRILESMHVDYVGSSDIRSKVESEWLGVSVEQMLNKHYDVLVPKLFGPDALEQSKKPVKLPLELFGEE